MLTRSQRLRQRGPMPKLSESEVLTMEVVGSYLGISQDEALLVFFQEHDAHFFPGLTQVHRTTFVRQAANVWTIKERVWMTVRDEMIRHDALIGIIDSMPLPVCRFARTPWCVRFRGGARYGNDHADRQTFDGFRLHLRLGWPGVITHAFLAPANEPDGEMAPIVLEGTQGVVLGDRASWVPDMQASLRTDGIILQAPPPAPPMLPRRLPPTVRCWARFALRWRPSLGNSLIVASSSASGHAIGGICATASCVGF